MTNLSGRLVLTSIRLRASSHPPAFLLPLYSQHRTFISRLLRRRSKKDDGIANSNVLEPPQKPKVPKRKSEQHDRGKLVPNPLLSKDTQIAASQSQKIEQRLAPRKAAQLWKTIHPLDKRAIRSQALSQGWSPFPPSTIPPLSVIEAALKNRDALKPTELTKIQSLVPAAVRRRGRLSRLSLIKRTERSLVERSPHIKTSVKKLGPLARQIAGKKIEDAMVQMRFSKKRAAEGVLKHLEYARNKAIAREGMGLGKPLKSMTKAEEMAQGGELEALQGRREAIATGQLPETPVVVRDRKSKRQVISDRSAIYVDQAWVGRGKWEYGIDYRARGRGYRLYKPFTSITVMLKEERTRLREARERQAKRARKPVWVPLPDRPVTAQRQYLLW